MPFSMLTGWLELMINIRAWLFLSIFSMQPRHCALICSKVRVDGVLGASVIVTAGVMTGVMMGVVFEMFCCWVAAGMVGLGAAFAVVVFSVGTGVGGGLSGVLDAVGWGAGVAMLWWVNSTTANSSGKCGRGEKRISCRALMASWVRCAISAKLIISTAEISFSRSEAL
jgi:hypothetical protein